MGMQHVFISDSSLPCTCVNQVHIRINTYGMYSKKDSVLEMSKLALPILCMIGTIGLSNAAVNSTDGSFNHYRAASEIEQTSRTPGTPIETEKRDRLPTGKQGTETGNSEYKKGA